MTITKSHEYELLMTYTVDNLERLFMLAALVYKQFQEIYKETSKELKDELTRQYKEKVNQVLYIDLCDGVRVAPDLVREFVEEINYLFVEDPNAYPN